MNGSLRDLIYKSIAWFKGDVFFSRLRENTFFRKGIPLPEYFHPNHYRVVRRKGAKFKVYPQDLSQWLLYASINEAYGLPELAFSLKKNNSNITILDIGANVGQFSLMAAAMLYKQEQHDFSIYAFEPNPYTAKFFRQNLDLNPMLSPKIQLEQLGVGAEKIQLDIQMPIRNTGAGSFRRNYSQEAHVSHAVDIITLDEYCTQHKIQHLQFLKIDVEGFELQVLQGGKQTLSRFRPYIYLEINAGGSSTSDGKLPIHELLWELGYTLSVEEHGKKQKLDKNNWAKIYELPLHNMLAVP